MYLYASIKHETATKIGYKLGITGLSDNRIRYVDTSGQVPPKTVAAILIPAEIPEYLHDELNDAAAVAANGPTYSASITASVI